MKIVGESIIRVDAKSKASGVLEYSDDMEFNGLYASIVRSSVACGEILSIKYDEDFDFSEFVIVDYTDIEGKNTNPVLLDDQPFLAEKYVRFIGEPILLVAHSSKELLKEFHKHINIEYKKQTPLLSMEDSFLKKKIIYANDNIYKNIHVCRGVKKDSPLLELEKTYTTSYQEQLYLEPQSMIAFYNDTGIKIVGSMQCPFYVEFSLESLTGKKIEVQQAPTGGAFGGKEDYPSLMAAYVYLLSKKSKKDVKLVLNRSEDIAFTPKRHPSKISLKSSFTQDGTLSSLEVKILLDGGAYATLSPVVLARIVLHVAGFYEIDFIDVDAYALATNTPPNGAFRGFGAPQALFAIERHIDDIARFLNLSPADVRAINLPTQETKTLTDVKIKEYKNVRNIFQKAREKSDFDKKYTQKKPYKGIGMALFMHGGGFVGLGEQELASEVLLFLNKEGIVEIKIGSTEMGQGAMTSLAQIVAQELSIEVSLVQYQTPNTKTSADSGPTVSSRTVMVVGGLLKEAAKKLQDALGVYKDIQGYKKRVRAYLQTKKQKEFRAKYKKPEDINWDEDKFYGNGYSAYSLGCYVVEVEIDRVDFHVDIRNFYALNDVGEIVNPTLAEGQVEGGITQGIGYALYEQLVYENGAVKNPHISNYITPMALDLTKIDIEFLNVDESSKGLGELPVDGVAPAILNAISNALSCECNEIPLNPEKLEILCR